MKFLKYFLPILLGAQLFANELPARTLETLPKKFQATIPLVLKGNLKLVEIRNRCNGCPPWHDVDFYHLNSRKPYKQEKISVKDGYTSMYTFPGTAYFANVKIEESVNNQYKHDRKIIIDAITHMFQRKKALIDTALEKNPSLKKKMTPFKAKGKDFIDLEEKTYRGYQYIAYTENVLNLTGSVISQIHIFVPERDITITAYLLNQKKTKFQTIDDFLKLKDDFIKSYIDFLSKGKN